MYYLSEVKGLGKGLGSIGAKMSKAAGMPGMDVSANTKPVQPPAPKEEPAKEEAPMSPEEEEALAAEQGPEVVEQLPEPDKIVYDKLGAPNKSKLTGHIVRRGDRDYVLDWDDEFEVYKLVEPETLRVRTRVRPASISTIGFRAGTIKKAVSEAVSRITSGAPVSSLVSRLLDGRL